MLHAACAAWGCFARSANILAIRGSFMISFAVIE